MVENTAGEASPKKSKMKAGIVAGVIAAVVIVVGVGMFVWHEQPSFCSAICHTPMSEYLPTYESEPGQPTVDKWGNEVSDASSMLAATHRTYGKTCLDCHVPTLNEQVSEGIGWITGNYYAPLFERSTSDLTEARGTEGDEFCLNESCHNMTREDLVEKTSDFGTINPHLARHGEYACSDCHKAHRASVTLCSQCHEDAKIPEGWVSGKEGNQLSEAEMS